MAPKIFFHIELVLDRLRIGYLTFEGNVSIVFHFIFYMDLCHNTLGLFFMLFLQHSRHYMTTAKGGGFLSLNKTTVLSIDYIAASRTVPYTL
jgi:hypothetical protein